ncbi:MAG: stalk domain-containing protein [Clostridia bacterium]
MKKFLSLFLISVCLLLSANLAFAEEIINAQMDEPVIIKEKTGFKTVDGYVKDSQGEYTSILNGEYIKDSKTNMTYQIRGNYFIANILVDEIGDYDFEFVLSEKIKKDSLGYYYDRNENQERDNGEETITPPSFVIAPQVKLDEDFMFDMDKDNYFIVSGTLDGMNDKTISVRIKEGTTLASDRIEQDGSFAILINPNSIRYASDIELVLKIDEDKEIVLREGIIKAKELDASINTSSFMEGMINRNVEVSVNNISKDFLEDDILASNYKLKAELLNDDGDKVEVDDQSLLIRSGESRRLAFDAFNYRALRELAEGEYEVKVYLLENINSDWKPIAQNKVSLSVLEADQDILVEEVFRDRNPGTIKIDFGGEEQTSGSDDFIYYKDGKPIKSARSTNSILGGYVLTYNSPGEVQKTVHTLKTDSNSSIYPESLPAGLNRRNYLEDSQILQIPVYQGGEFEFTLEVYEVVDNQYSLIYRESDEFAIEGYNASVETSLIYATKETPQSITIKDNAGEPINNALIYIGQQIHSVKDPQERNNITRGFDKDDNLLRSLAYLYIDPSATNIIDGVYNVDNFTLEDLGEYNIVVYSIENGTAKKMAVLENVIEVVGEEVYNVEVDKNLVRPGTEQTYYIKVRDNEGVQVVPYEIDILEDGLVYDVIRNIEINSLQTPQGIKIVYSASDSLKEELSFRVKNETNAKTGIANVNISNTEIIFDSLTPLLTDGIKQPINFVLVDSNSKEEITEDITLELINGGSGAELRVFDRQTGKEFFGKIPGQEKYELEFLVHNLNAEEIEKANVRPKVRIKIGDVIIYDIEVKQASLYVEPSRILPATDKIKIHYKDAKNDGIHGKEIRINNSLIGETDQNGEIEQVVSQETNVFNISAETDVSGYYKELSIKRVESVNETEVVDAPRLVSSPSVNVRIRNDYPMLYILVNNERQDYFMPIKSYTAKVEGLEPGWNTIKVDIYDFRHISSSYTVEVFYKEKKESVEIQLGEQTSYGTPTLLLGHTMVPVRFANELGAEMSWDNESKTVVYSYYDTTIELQSGNSYGYINGVREKLPAAPYMNEVSRLMVPLRMVAEELGYKVDYADRFSPIVISND